MISDKAQEMNQILSQLSGGDLRSVGKVGRVVKSVLADKTLFDDVFTGLLQDNPVIRMRAADAVEKITKIYPEWLGPYKSIILKKLVLIEDKEIRWHIAQIVPRPKLSKNERMKISQILFEWLKNKKESKIVRVMAMQALADLSVNDIPLRNSLKSELRETGKSEAPSLISRSKKIFRQLEEN
jgi:hypothetical protein